MHSMNGCFSSSISSCTNLLCSCDLLNIFLCYLHYYSPLLLNIILSHAYWTKSWFLFNGINRLIVNASNLLSKPLFVVCMFVIESFFTKFADDLRRRNEHDVNDLETSIQYQLSASNPDGSQSPFDFMEAFITNVSSISS